MSQSEGTVARKSMSKSKRTTRTRRARRGATEQLVRHGLAAGLLALGACGESHAPDAAESRSSEGGVLNDAGARDAAASEHADTPARDASDVQATASETGVANQAGDSGVEALLSSDVVRPGAVARKVLYSWTTDRQVMELRSTPTLLTRSESSTNGRTNLSSVLATRASAGEPMAQLLSRPEFQKGRYAWSNAWATRRGWPDESYGRQLLRIVLKPEALIAIFSVNNVWLIDMEDREVDVALGLAQPERIAAVYFVNGGSAGSSACGTFAKCPAGAYREFFINNERMVQEWSLGTESILRELQRSITLVQALRDSLVSDLVEAREECAFATATLCAWLGEWGLGAANPPSARAALEKYRQALALTSEYYEPTVANMDALLADLRASLFTPDPLTHEP
jgi:hypothetical protein